MQCLVRWEDNQEKVVPEAQEKRMNEEWIWGPEG